MRYSKWWKELRRSVKKRPKIAFARPHQWGKKPCEGHSFEFIEVPLFGTQPKLRDGSEMGDAVGGVITKDGMSIAREIFSDLKPEIFLFWPMYYLDGSANNLQTVVRFLQDLKMISPNTRFVYGNGNQQGELDFNVQAFLPVLDAVLTNSRDPFDYETFKKAGVHTVGTLYQFGFDPLEHGRFRRMEPTHDCFFAGSQTHDPDKSPKYPFSRWRYDFLLRAHTEFNLVVHGKGRWPFIAKPYLYGQNFYDAFTKAKIILGSNHWDLYRYYTRRTVYALASGRMYLVRYIPGMEKDFLNHTHLVWFKEIEEGIDAIRYYLNHGDQAEQIGQAGREKALEMFSWRSMQLQFELIASRHLL